MDKRTLGQRGEEAAVAYLERAGIAVVDRNWTAKAGEIDIVALDGTELVLIEVKTRRSTKAGMPEEAVTPAKQKRYQRLAVEYLHEAGLEDCGVRFDVISILVISADRALLRHHRAAFVFDR